MRALARPLAASFLLLCAVAAPAAAQGPKRLGNQLRAALRDVGADPESVEPALAVIRQLAALDEAKAAEALLAAAEQIEQLAAPILEKRRKGLVAEGGSGRLKRTRYELRNLYDAGERVGDALAGMKSQDALHAMLQQVTDRGATLPLWLRLQLAARAGELEEQRFDWRSGETVGGEKKKADADTLLAMLSVAASLGKRGGEAGSGAWVVRQLAHDNRDVRLAAVRALGRLAWPGGIEPLVAELEQDDVAIREAALAALMSLTGQRPGDGAASWRAWLKAEGAAYVRGEKPLGGGPPKPKKGEGRKKPSATTAGTFFGIEQAGAGILYVFDNSQSMQARVGGKPKPDQPQTGDAPQTRWDLCRRELKASLRALRPEQTFNLVSFADKARSFDERMLPANAENVARAIAWIDGLKLEFQTNTYDALDLAFQIAGRGATDRYYASQVDTIFFLTDGAPTIANLKQAGIGSDDADRILRAVRRWNALGRVTIHAVGMNLQARKDQRNPKNGRLWPIWFLRLLAEQNGGSYETARR